MPVTIDLDRNGRIAEVNIPRPGWNSEARSNVPTSTGQDRRHVVAWAMLKEQIIRDLTGKTVQDAEIYLASEGIMAETLEDAVSMLARESFNKIENLYAGPSAQNRTLGSRIAEGEKFIREALDTPDGKFSRDVNMTVTDTQGRVTHEVIPIRGTLQAIEWAFNMCIDWENVDDIQRGEAAFLKILKGRGIALDFKSVEAELESDNEIPPSPDTNHDGESDDTEMIHDLDHGNDDHSDMQDHDMPGH